MVSIQDFYGSKVAIDRISYHYLKNGNHIHYHFHAVVI